MSHRADRIPVTLCRGNPARACPYCGRSRFGSMPCKRRTCPSYASRWAYDWRIVLLENLIAYRGRAVMYTLTPPGADVLPWDRTRCSHPSDVECSGKRGCVVETDARARWNASCQRRLSRLYETVQAAVGREVGVRANVLAIGKEAQRRGPIHVHYVLGVETADELRTAKAFHRHLERLSQQRRYLFGHVHGKFVKPKPAREAAAYLSSYFLGGRGHKATLTEAVLNPETPRLPLYVSRRLTAVTRTTMRNKRRQRHVHVCQSRGLPYPAWASDREALLDVLCLAFDMPTRLASPDGMRRLAARRLPAAADP